MSITGVDASGACDTCLWPTDDLQRRAGDDVCERCDAVFTAAHALLDNGVSEEAAVIGTLGFAWGKVGWAADPHDYGVMELQAIMDGVPVLRLPNVTADVVTYDGSRIPKTVRIDVYVRSVTRKRVAETYGELLEVHKIHFDRCSAGRVDWDAKGASLTLTIRAEKELQAWRVPYFDTYPTGPMYSFPPPVAVGGFYGTLLGSTDKRTFSGYARVLAGTGRHTPRKAVVGCVAWLLGEKDKDTPPREWRPRIARALNKHLLGPRGERKLPEGHWVPDDTVWRDAHKLGPRLMRVLYHLQESRRQQFP